jgi:uncharacterized protein (DUF362 family)
MTDTDHSGPEASTDKPRRINRRRALLIAGAGVVAGLGVAGAIIYRRGGASTAAAATIRDHRVVMPASTPRLVIARGPSPAKNVQAALEKMGGIGRFVVRGDVVVVKPNIGWDRIAEQAANTDPEVVATVVQACLGAGAAQVIVTDMSCNDPGRSFSRSGIAAAARAAGATALLPAEIERRGVEIPGKPGRWSALEPLVRANKVINVPVAKHHGYTRVTAGMKNWFGAIEGNRGLLHVGVDEAIVGLAEILRPTLTIVDATRVLQRGGPSGGNLDDVKRVDAVAVSLDPVAVDAWAATQLGLDPKTIGHIALAEKRGLGVADFKSIAPVEISV